MRFRPRIKNFKFSDEFKLRFKFVAVLRVFRNGNDVKIQETL